MAWPNSSVDSTSSGTAVFGSTCRNMIFTSPYPQEPGRVDVGLLAHGQHRPSHQARVAWNRGDPDRDHDIRDAGPESGDDDKGQEYAWKSQHRIHHAHEHRVHRAPVVSGHEPDRRTERRTDGHADEAQDE